MITERHASLGVVWHTFPGLGDSRRVLAAISTRHGGVSDGGRASLNVGDAVGDDPARVRENRARLYRALAIDPGAVTSARQVHGRRIVYRDGVAELSTVDDCSEPADGLITDRPGVALCLRFADCVPILAYDERRRVAGIAHAGWRGTLAGIAGELIRAMDERFSSRPQDVRVALGPSIGPCCYEVGSEIVAACRRSWSTADRFFDLLADRPRLDLWQANRQQILDRGVPHDQVAVAGICTACRCDEFFSHRAQRGNAGRFAAVIALR